ncbi:Specific transcriptional repressor [Mycena sanguinolenta]|uniref:[histone H3]-trimethyl-L-lysine(9) demethylase n=1 Tax=Mycena sanguinolenta TaxID=230812 RepID=A0A8H7D6I2_9AGAR|nr:Specific transcriptional repressor [Mycena sanguinolenta]
MSSPVSSLTASRSSSPEPCVQPDHFYGDASHLPPSPDSDKAYLSPEDDPLAHRGIPVFKPTMAEFADFEGYMNRVECWGRRSGIVKVVPPAEWTAALPDITPQLSAVKIKSPIEQFMRGRAGLFRQENVEKRKQMSVREWAELCAKDEFRAPSKDHVGVHNGGGVQHPPRTRRKKQVKEKEQQNAEKDKEEVKVEQPDVAMASPPNSPSPDPDDSKPEPDSRSAKARNRRVERADKDASFLETFHPHTDWLPPSTTAADYTPEFCAKLERTYWRNCGLGKPAWYGADTMGSLFLPTTTAWNVASLPSTLSRLLPASTGLPGVNTPYLYFGMWRATFAWHVEDMDLFSINYIHFGAPKFWYAVPQGRANALEDTMRGYFPKDTSQCPQFLRHKSFLASPTLLAQSAVRPNHLVQHAGEFVITYPRGYHAGFNLGLNCAESVNFALDSWLDEGRKAAVCKCVDFSVRIDVDQLLEDRRIEALELIDPAAAAHARAVRDGLEVDVELEPAPAIEEQEQPKPKSRASDPKPDAASGALSPTKRSPRKRKPTAPFEIEPDPKRPRVSSGSSTSHSKPKPITLNLVGPRPLLPIPNASSSSYSSSHTHPHTQSSTSAPPPGGQKLTLRLGPRPSSLPTPPTPEIETSYPCCLCVDPSLDGLARVHDLPAAWRELAPAARVHFPPQGLGNKSGSWIHFAGVPGAAGTTGGKGVWMAHERCAMVLPETWVDEITGERVVFGVDGIVRARWTLKCSVCTRARSKMHGALIQCAKGKCPKAFHVSCAQNGASNGSGIAYKVVNEVEKEVVLLEPTPGANAAAPSADANAAQGEDPDVRVLKVIKKTEVEALCAQHNPVIVAERRANKAEGLRADILALAPLSRIKIRVSAGVFEVTLVRVHEDRRSVEVLWDTQGDVREFKWGAVILGQTSLPTTQVPDFPAPNANANPNVTAYGSNANARGPDAHGYWANAASAARPPVITIPAPAARFSSTNAASPSSSSTPQQQQQPQTNSAQPKAQAPAHNPYSVFKYWPAPAGQYASYSVARSATAPGTQSTSAVPYVPMAQYYTGPQPWSSQYYRPGTASTSTSTSTPYYPSITVPRAAQAQASSSASASAPASDPTPTPTSAPSSTSMQDIQSTPAPAPAPSSASPTTTSAQTPTSAPRPDAARPRAHNASGAARSRLTIDQTDTTHRARSLVEDNNNDNLSRRPRFLVSIRIHLF